MDRSDSISATVAAVAPALAIDNEAHALRLAIQLTCGAQAGALVTRLNQLVLDAELAAICANDRMLAELREKME